MPHALRDLKIIGGPSTAFHEGGAWLAFYKDVEAGHMPNLVRIRCDQTMCRSEETLREWFRPLGVDFELLCPTDPDINW